MTMRTRRIAEAMAGTPYRVLSVNKPYDFTDFVPGFVFNGRLVTETAAVAMVNQQAPIIYADDVLNSVAESLKGHNFTKTLFKMMGAPRAIPPFDQMFIDVEMDFFVSDTDKKNHQNYAMFVQTDPLAYLKMKNYEEVKRELCIFYARSWVGMQCQELGMDEETINVLQQTEEYDKRVDSLVERFLTLKQVGVYSYLYTQHEKKPNHPYGPWALTIYLLDEDYKVLQVEGCSPETRMMCDFNITDIDGRTKTELEPVMRRGWAPGSKGEDGDHPSLDLSVGIAIQTISLLNCSNVHMLEKGTLNSDMTRKQREAGRYVGVRHHELRVKVGEQFIRVDGRNEEGHCLNPLHSVRGHFRDYSTGKGLFGKYKYNCVWVPQFVRGSAEDGIVTRDYVLENAEKETANG